MSLDDTISLLLKNEAPSIRALSASTSTPDELRRRLEESGLIDKLSKKAASTSSLTGSGTPPAIGTTTATATTTTAPSANPLLSTLNKDKKYLLFSVQRGRAFLALSDVSEDPTTSLQIHLNYKQLRHSSTPVMSTVEPSLDFQRILQLDSTDPQLLLQSSDKIHLVVTRLHHPSGSTSLIGTTLIDFRDVLCGRPVKKLVEIKESGEDVTLGILEVLLELVPRDSITGSPISSEEIAFQLKREQRQFDEINRLFYVHAKQWWNDYLQIRTCHAQRLVKIFAHDETGTKLPVTNFISPIRSRYIESPRHASRFVSLLGVEKLQGVGSSKTEVWAHPHTILTLSKSNLPSLSNLLTSLLIGFNLNAYTALGTTHNSEVTAWVITVSTSGAVEYIDPATGRRYGPTDETPWRTVGCVFNDEGFWANVGVSDHVPGTNWDFGNGKYWKPLGRDAALSMKKSQQNFPLLPFIASTHKVMDGFSMTDHTMPPITSLETDLELVLRNQIAIFRDDHDLLTVWDDDLAHLLGQCLSGCEMGKLYPKKSGAGGGGVGGMVGSGAEGVNGAEFQEGVKRGIPEGHTFKGFPIHFNTLNPQKIFSAFAQAKACQNLMLTKGDKVRFGVRVKVIPYAEKCVACWVMVAVRYKAYMS
ncbi:hypothetical protein BCR33DRAFT_717893 [Rhizoclosmatium globosum]|uniref:Uncharacterized protein n=1 Tax=Rhizoclosmatium globosum TaxID=329046 RepID=A0A1Y2C8D2_9FUNG|nr:hypothetical protein BCR33DRAFT_717893 [Rhizoclosmatium globosum]|eukprot:ORY43157.1 hypothetical protein BCR33DRAFT_717893 [Rhizoclosmatium globosum]